ncbi:serine--tRNA ligase [Candidatus Saccharibacteria bacterium]|nr:serine--tRNA ligase [Candidatus Saccharibacteria bacterium]
MLDIRYIRENSDQVAEKSRQKGYEVDIPAVLELDNKYRALLQKKENFSRQRNELAKQIRGDQSSEQIERGRSLREEEKSLTAEFEATEKLLVRSLAKIPNIFPEDTPLGGEEANRNEKKWGVVSEKDFDVLDHLSWGEKRSLIDFERGAKVAGNKFYFLKGVLVELEFAIFQLGLALAKKYGFTAMQVPHMVSSKVLEGAGFSARGEEKQIYKIEDEDLHLIATAEIPLTGYHTDEIIDFSNLPILYAGLSPAYRVEGGAYGKHNRGLYRTHQFNKLELYVLCKPEESELWHQKLLELEEELCQALEIPYRVVRIASGDLGAPAYKKYDIEYWTPVDKSYRELTSCSNVTDYQARRLNIRYRDSEGKIAYLHTLNATAAAMSRVTIALVENHQDKDGTIHVPKALQFYFGSQTSF